MLQGDTGLTSCWSCHNIKQAIESTLLTKLIQGVHHNMRSGKEISSESTIGERSCVVVDQVFFVFGYY
jgi:hypothetical protein